jgi:hypothetical protein
MSTGELLKVVTTSLARATSTNLGIKGQTLGEYYREYSAESTHELDIRYTTIYTQLKTLIYTNSELVSLLGKYTTLFIERATSAFISNIIQEAVRKKYSIVSNYVIIDTSKNKFQRVRDLINIGFKTSSAYRIQDFLKEVAQSTSSKISIANIDKIDFGKKFGFDIGHVESNIASAFAAVIFNGIRRSKVDYPSDELIKSISSLEAKLTNPKIAAEIMQRTGITDKELFFACVEATVGFTKRILNNKVDIILKTEPKLDRTVLKNIAKSVKDKVFPEVASINQRFGSTFEKSLSNHLTTVSTGYFLKFLNDITIETDTKYKDILDIKGSPSSKELLYDYVESIVLHKGKKLVNSTTNVKIVKKAQPTARVGSPKKQKSSLVPKSSVSLRLRSTSGSFQSVVNLQGLLAARLQEVIRKNMAPPALTYQTGRFVESVKLNSVQFDNRQNALTAFLSYMKYPYATFEVGGKQGNVDKSPYALIDRSVREIAAQLTKSRMRTVIV